MVNIRSDQSFGSNSGIDVRLQPVCGRLGDSSSRHSSGRENLRERDAAGPSFPAPHCMRLFVASSHMLIIAGPS